MLGLATVLGLDRPGWIALVAAVLLALISLSTYRSKQEFLASLPRWRRLLQKLNCHPTVELKVQRYALEKENARLTELNDKLVAILASP